MKRPNLDYASPNPPRGPKAPVLGILIAVAVVAAVLVYWLIGF